MLAAVVGHAGFADLLDPVLSVEGTGRFKTDPADLRPRHRRAAACRPARCCSSRATAGTRSAPPGSATRRSGSTASACRSTSSARRRPAPARALRTCSRSFRHPHSGTYPMTLDLAARRGDQRADPARLRDHPHRAGARPGRQAAPRLRAAPPGAARARAPSGRSASTPASAPTSSPRRRRSATATGRSRRCRRRCNAAASRSPARSTPRWSSTPSTRARTAYMTDFEDSNSPLWTNQIQGQINIGQAIRRTLSSRRSRPRHQELQAQRQDRDAAGAAARLAPRREARDGRRPARLRRHLRLRPLHVPQRQGAAGARRRPVLLPAQAGEPPRGAALERHLRA